MWEPPHCPAAAQAPRHTTPAFCIGPSPPPHSAARAARIESTPKAAIGASTAKGRGAHRTTQRFIHRPVAGTGPRAPGDSRINTSAAQCGTPHVVVVASGGGVLLRSGLSRPAISWPPELSGPPPKSKRTARGTVPMPPSNRWALDAASGALARGRLFIPAPP